MDTPIETMKPRYDHAEAFCLMRYESKDGSIVEHLWNSRDGVTPFVIRSRDGKTDLTHTMRHMECRPFHKPQVGDRIFINLTREKAQEYAQLRSVANSAMWEERYPTDAEKAAALLSLTESFYAGGRAPDVVTVTEEVDIVDDGEAALRDRLKDANARLRLEQVRNVVATWLAKPLEQIRPESDLFRDLGADSMDLAEILMQLEQDFSIRVANDAWGAWRTVGDIAAFIEKETSNPQDGSGLGDC